MLKFFDELVQQYSWFIVRHLTQFEMNPMNLEYPKNILK